MITDDIMINEYNYKINNDILIYKREKYNYIYDFIKNWLELNNITIKSLLIEKIYLHNLPSLEKTYDYMITHYCNIIEQLNIDYKLTINKNTKLSYNTFFKFLKLCLSKIEYILYIYNKTKYIRIKSKYKMI